MKKFWITLLLIGAVISSSFAEPAKIALVVGNAAYSDGIPMLANPANDASDISSVLEKNGWRVTKLVDANRREFNRSIIAFQDALKGNPGSTALFYYAGHGVQIEGKNYMLPIGEVFEAKEDVKLSAFCIDSIVDAFTEGRSKDSLIILDACREDPFAKTKTRAIGATRGLAVIPVPESEGGSATILATKAGDVAQDGTGRNGLFTEAFLKNFDAGLSLDQFFLKVRADVVAKTGGQQTPQIQTSGILNGFYLGKRNADQAPIPQQPIPQQTLPAVPVSIATAPQKTTGFVTIIPNANNQSSTLLISATREGTGIIHDLTSDNPNELAEGIYMVRAMLADDIEPVYQRILNIDPGTSVKVNLPAIAHSVAFQRKILVDQKNALIPAYQRAESSAKTKRLFGWLSFGVGLASAGFSAYEYLAGQSAYTDYLNATSTSAAESARTLSTTSSTLFSISAVTSGLMFTISPFLLFSDPASKTRSKIEVIDQKLTLLDLEGGKK